MNRIHPARRSRRKRRKRCQGVGAAGAGGGAGRSAVGKRNSLAAGTVKSFGAIVHRKGPGL